MNYAFKLIQVICYCILFLYSGPVLGSSLYSLGGFSLPFISVGSVGIILAVCLLFAMPSGEYDKKADPDNSKADTLTWGSVFKV